jgi:hypothetical protein
MGHVLESRDDPRFAALYAALDGGGYVVGRRACRMAEKFANAIGT